MMKKISAGLTLMALIICLGLWLMHVKAWHESVAASELNCRESGICFAAHGPNTYEYAADRYLRIQFFLLIFFAGLFFQPRMLSISVCLSSVFLILYQFWQIHQFYSLLKDMFPDYGTEPFFYLLRDSVPFIYLCFSIIGTLVIAQFEVFFKPKIGKRL
jgi:hypothetical protein